MKNLAPFASALSGVFLLGLMSASSASAATFTWSDIASTTSWDLAGNWVENTSPPTSSSDYTAAVVFNQTSYQNQPLIGTSRSVNGLTLGDGSTATAATTITMGTNQVLRIGAGGIDKKASSGTLTFSGSMRLNTGAQSWVNNSSTAITVGTSGTTATIGSTGGLAAWTLSGSGSGNTVVHNIISGASGTTSVTVDRTGSGTVTFTNANVYTGGTTVTSGSLLVNNIAGSGTGTGAVSVGASGRLGGTGSVSGATTLLAGGAIAPGSGGAGTFSGSSLTWNTNGSTAGMFFDLGANQAASDQFSLTGAFAKGSGSGFIFNFTDLGVTPSFTYTLVTFGSTSFTDANVFSALGVSGTFGLTANSLTFTTAAIPEPSSAAALASGLALAAAAVRRRRHA